MNTKTIPLLFMLIAGAVTSIIMYLNQYDSRTMLTILLAVLVVFYIAGLILGKMIESFERQRKEAAAAAEGEVIEKQVESPSEDDEKES